MISDETATANVAANVRRLLDQRGWTQSDLAKKTGESENNISRISRGLNVVRIGVLARVAEAFDVSTDRLLAPPPTPLPPEFSVAAVEKGLQPS